MGWAAFKLKRTKDNVDLGEITIFFPQVSEQFSMGNRTFHLPDLLQYPDFPIEAHIFVFSPTVVSIAENFGFPHIIDVSIYRDETWTLNNGSYIKFSSGSSLNVPWNYYLSDGTAIGAGNADVSSNKSGGRVCWMPYLLGDNSSGTSTGFISNSGLSLYSGNVPETIYPSMRQFFDGAKPIYITDDPYGDGGMTEPGGGTGDFDGTGDNIDIPSLPTLSAVDAGFITLFNPTLGQLNSLASYMWSDLFDINSWRKIFADPMQAILGLSIVPVNVPSTGEKPVKVGNISTGVSMTVAASQYVSVDCGTLNVNEFWGAYLDYDPYTKAEIYLPYIGTHPLATDDIMNKPVHVVYHVDILSGACCAHVKCGGSVLYSFIGQCASSIPITGDNWTNVINGAINIAGAIGSMVATGGASAPMAIGQIASTAVNQMKPSVEKSGAMGGTGGMLGVQTPYLILTRPRQALPRDQNAFIGYPSFITENLGSLSGYTEIDSIHLENVPATEPELSEIETLLKSGVIF